MLKFSCVGWKTAQGVIFMKKTERITIRIESEKFKQLQAIANKKDISVSAKKKKILKEYILDKWKE